MNSDIYHPIHLVARAHDRMGDVLIAIGAGVTALTCLAAAIRMRPTRNASLGWFVLCLATPLIFVAGGELASGDFRFTIWEGANYLIPVAGVAVLHALRLAAPAEIAAAASLQPSPAMPVTDMPVIGPTVGGVLR